MVLYNSIDDINLQQWHELVRVSSTASFFQTEECYRFFESLSFLRPFVIGMAENDVLTGVVCGYIIADGNPIKSFLSRRAIICGGPMLHPNASEEALLALLTATRTNLHSRSIYTEFRNYTDYAGYKAIFEKVGFSYYPHLNFHVQTPSVDAAMMQLNTTKRRDVRLTKRSGGDWFESRNHDDLVDFYRELELLYKTKVKTPLFPIEFFEKLIEMPHGHFFVVKYDGRVVGGSICVELEGRVLYEWFVCGLDGMFKNILSSTVATWAAIEYAAGNGFNRFDMMGAGKPGDGYGVREFKSKFGGDLVEHGRFQVINQPLLYEVGKLGIEILKNGFKRKRQEIKSDMGYVIETNPLNIDKNAWSEFVKNHPDGNIFHTPEMYAVYEHTNKFKPVVLIATNFKGNIVGCLISVIQREYKGIAGELTTRSVIFGGPLAENNSTVIADALLLKYNKIIKRKAIYSQFRNLKNTDSLKSVFLKNGFEYEDHLDILLDLTKTKEELELNLHKERRRNIAKAEKEGLLFNVLTSEPDIHEVIELIRKTYARVRVPMSYEELFIHAQTFLGAKVMFFGAEYEGKIIAGQVRLCYNDVVYAWYAGSDSAYFQKKPNDFLLWNVILWAKENNYKTFDFGGAGKPNVEYGVRDYKLKFGGELVCFGRYEKVNNKFLMKTGKLLYSIYKKIKR